MYQTPQPVLIECSAGGCQNKMKVIGDFTAISILCTTCTNAEKKESENKSGS